MVKIIYAFLLGFMLVSVVYAEEKGGEKGQKGSPDNLHIPDIVIPILVKEEVQAYYNLSLTIEPKEESKKDVLAEFGPRIKDAIIHDLYVTLPLVWSKDQPPSVEKIKKRLESIAQKATPENTIGHININAYQLSDAKKDSQGTGASK